MSGAVPFAFTESSTSGMSREHVLNHQAVLADPTAAASSGGEFGLVTDLKTGFNEAEVREELRHSRCALWPGDDVDDLRTPVPTPNGNPWLQLELAAAVGADVAGDKGTGGAAAKPEDDDRNHRGARVRRAAKRKINWVQCDSCGKWRILPAGTPVPDSSAPWSCKDLEGCSCSDEEESEELDDAASSKSDDNNDEDCKQPCAGKRRTRIESVR